ncbi:SET domain-containing protein 4 [Zerene cesonia]|uniref:SET domain-containing protein 4 n=1 Tax=Zerene cesonia TaxID=33412 RepID=UPI0018E52A38|nr:SET domain-containing protein 4 [Zerene cesonia]
MGRTGRWRKQKREYNFHTCNEHREVILLNSWLAQYGIRRSKKLSLAVFKDSDRGVLTKKKIKAGEEIINLPLNLTINVITLLIDADFNSIFLDNDKQCLVEYKQCVTFQSLLAFYLLFLKSQDSDSKWHTYLRSLPQYYTVPYFLNEDVQNYLNPEILAVIEKQKSVVDESFDVFVNILVNIKSDKNNIQKFSKYFTKSHFEWAYFTVNTRCVYMDLSNLINLTNKDSTILAIINDNTRISLCPFLDMINHSANCSNETKLLVNKEIENIPLVNLTEDIFSEVRFSIYTKNDFKAYSQVFICYGDSYNLKLITEYGFYLPLNDLDYVEFEFEKIKLFCSSRNIKFSQEQCNFIYNHGLNKDLYIDGRGLSFNFYGLLLVVKYFYNEDVNVSRLLYSAAICSYDRVLIDFIKPFVKNKIVDTKYALDKLQDFDQCNILNNCIQLMCQYVRILEKFIKS